jgi:hypothetical protein
MAVNKDWTGNYNSIYKTIGASNHTTEDRQNEDYYATPSNVTEMLWNLEDFSETIVGPACGEGHIAEVFKAHKHKVIATDLIDRGYGTGGIDFFDMHLPMDADIVTNPPYSMAKEFVEHAMELVTDGHKVAMLLKLTFLEGQKRKRLFEKYPPKTIYVSTTRIGCAKNGQFKYDKDGNIKMDSAVCYAWFVWEKGFHGDPRIKWFN